MFIGWNIHLNQLFPNNPSACNSYLFKSYALFFRCCVYPKGSARTGRSTQHSVHRVRVSIWLMKCLNDKYSALKPAMRAFQRQTQKTKHWSSTNLQGLACSSGSLEQGACACVMCTAGCWMCSHHFGNNWEVMPIQYTEFTVRMSKLLICNNFV